MDLPEIKKSRKPDHPIQSLILNRWSPRAMSGEEITEQELKSLLEAARWAPSSYNAQPWRFIYARRSHPSFPTFVDLLVEFNRLWAPKAAVLGVVASRKTFEKGNKPSHTHAYDAGAAWENFALEGCSRNLVVHGMEGFDYDKAKKVLKIPDEYEVHAMFAVGKKAPAESLPPDLQQREVPSGRKKVEEFAFEGSFK
jgi:nitroreductase